MTSILLIDPDSFSPQQLAPAADALAQGKLVVFPTETVYGLGAHALDPLAVSSIFKAKGRPANNPLIVHLASLEQVPLVAHSWPQTAQTLAHAFWPGPLTIVVPKHPDVPDLVTAGLPNVALRIPNHPVAQALLSLAGIPVCAPSANRYTKLSPTLPEHVLSQLQDRIDWLICAGPTQVGIESTVISLVNPLHPVILRPGMISQKQIQHVLPHLQIDYLTHAPDHEDAPLASPGLAKKHYAPNARVKLFKTSHDLPSELSAVGIIWYSTPDLPPGALSVTLGTDPTNWARSLYASLHHFDAQGVELIYIQQPPQSEPWRAIWNRLERSTYEP